MGRFDIVRYILNALSIQTTLQAHINYTHQIILYIDVIDTNDCFFMWNINISIFLLFCLQTVGTLGHFIFKFYPQKYSI